MKYLVLLADGMADYPLPRLDNRTPLATAHKPHMDYLAQCGSVGLACTVPEGMPPGSDVANLAVMGYNPQLYYTGRSPLEAASIGVDLSPDDVAFRCNLVTLSEQLPYDHKIMLDYSSDEITTAESAILIKDIAAAFNDAVFSFYPGISYRHLMVWHCGPTDGQLTPPHDISDRQIGAYLPRGNGAAQLLAFMERSQSVLDTHPVNQKRRERGLHAANSIWLWGQGKKPNISSFYAKYHLRGAVISAVDLAKGLGICAGLRVIEVPGATGNVHTNFRGKAEAALQAFRDGDEFVYLHIEAPDEAGHRGELDNKILAIEKIDAEVLGPILEQLPQIAKDFRILLMPDHPTPLALKTHVADPVPFVIYQHGQRERQYATTCFSEESAQGTGLTVAEGYTLMDRFIEA